MEKENEPTSIELALENFAKGLDDAADCVVEFDATISLPDLLFSDELAGHEKEMIEKLIAHFEVDLSNHGVVKTYSILGTPGTSGEGKITVRVFATKNPQVFLEEYTYSNGDIVWAIKPKEAEE